MNTITKLLVAFSILGFSPLASCGESTTEPPTPTTPSEGTDDNNNNNTDTNSSFTKGADISWVTEMENDGVKFYNSNGQETDCFQLMKDCGMNAIRLRVWVNPENEYGKYCDLNDVLNKAVRAQKLGLDIMIDFHYSDMFADPSRQNTPKAWESYSLAQLKTAVASHTKEVLTALKNKGITPKWVQVGNETTCGTLWPTGQLWDSNGDIANGWSNYVSLSNAGYDAVKAVFSNSIVIIHIDNAWEDRDWWFKKFKQYGGKMDMIGLSHYPQTQENKTWKEMNNLAITHIQEWSSTYNVPVMICEIGVKSSDESLGSTIISDFLTRAKSISNCSGVFYWEPQCYGNWKPTIYNTWGWGTYDMGAFTSNGRPSQIMNAFK